MRIAYLVNSYPRVSHTFIRREIAALERRGFSVGRFCMRHTPDQLVDDADRRERDATKVVLDGGPQRLLRSMLKVSAARPKQTLAALRTTLRLASRSDRGLVAHLAYLAEACVLLEWLDTGGYDHVHAHFGTNSTAVAMLVRKLGGPSYSFTAHGPEEFDNPTLLSLPDKIADAAFVVAVSSFGRSQLFRRCVNAAWEKIQVVRCGLDESLLTAEATPIPERPRLVSVARLSEQKGQLLLLEALAQVRRSGTAAELVLVGDGELRPLIEQRLGELDLQDCVTITGWADAERVRREITAGRVFVLPSFAEGLPVALMEALALARPVITTSIAGIPELVTTDCGWLVPAGSVEALANAIQTALDTPTERLEAMGLDGQRRVRAQHDVNTEAGTLAGLIERFSVRSK